MRFILISGLTFCIIFAYISYIEGSFRPRAGVTLYRKLYGMLYKKAGSVELGCFEDSDFYNRYALAVDKADENLSMIVKNLFAAAFQDYKVFALSIKENVMMRKAAAEDDAVVYDALKKAGVYEKVMSLPRKADTVLTKEFDEEGALLSGGEIQKIVVARAFAKDTPIKVFDEPSSALDPIAEYELYESILRDSRDKTMIFISHRLSSVRSADMILMLENGEIIERGTHDELMGLNGAYADMYNKQAKNYLAVENLGEVSAV